MIPKITSQELNNILSNATEKIAGINANIDAIKTDLHQKLLITKYETDYVNDTLYNLKSGMYSQNGNMKALIKTTSRMHTAYGSVAHAMFMREPTNVFNLKVGGTGEVFFRNDIKVSVNGAFNDTYKDIMKHESLPREIFFHEYTSPDVTLTLETEEANKMLGPSRFNMIEIDSFLNGSYDITELKIYKLNEDGTENDTPDTYSYPTVGKMRIVLPKKVSFYKIEMKVTIKYETYKNDIKVYPFGLKHIYLYDADFRPESYAIVLLQSDHNIESVNEDIKLKLPTGIKETTMGEEGIEIFADNNNGVFETPIPPSTSNQLNVIARDLKQLYVKIPLYNKAIIGASIEFTTK